MKPVAASLLLAACLALGACSVAPPAAAQAAAAPAAPAARPAVVENTGPNAAITRRAAGTYRYETISDGRVRGEERFQLFVHPDGSRTLNVWHDLAARNAQFTVVLRNGADFRALEAFVSYWNAAKFKGSAHFLVDGARVTTTSRGPYGIVPQSLEVPAMFTIGTHPVAGDGWHTAGYDLARGGVQTRNLLSVEAGTDLTRPVLGTLVPLTVERIGEETVEVPAGRFNAVRWRLSGVNDLWLVGEDRLVVKSVIAARDLQYVLTRWESDPALR
jgi:hypothetical protein